MSFFETVGATVVSALIIGLTVMAIKQPNHYRALRPALWGVFGIIYSALAGWMTGGAATEAVMLNFIGPADMLNAEQAAQSWRPNEAVLFFTGVAIIVFLKVLDSLEQMFSPESESSKD